MYALRRKIFVKCLQQMVWQITITHEITELGWWIEAELKSAKLVRKILQSLH